ncbi:MAG: cupredoxin domain-containing protein [Acidimicrobiia bacterium]
MKNMTLLSVGIGAVVLAFIGPAVAGGITGQGATPWGPFGEMQSSYMGYEHMGGIGSGMMFGGLGYDSEQVAPTIDDATEITVTLTDFTISPSQVVVVEGEPTNITVVNDGAAPHDFTVPDLGITIFVGPGETVTTGVSAQSAGSYDTLCTLPGHASLGMVGRFVVESRA